MSIVMNYESHYVRVLDMYVGVRYCKSFLEEVSPRNTVTLTEFQNASDSYLISGSLSFKSSVDRLARTCCFKLSSSPLIASTTWVS